MPGKRFTFALGIMTPTLTQSHGLESHSGLWNLDPWVLVPLGALTMLYGVGLTRRRKWPRHALQRIAAFTAAVLCLSFALVWPLEILSGRSFAAHMLQHMLLLSLAPPLLVIAQPLPVLLAALPMTFQRALVRGFRSRCRGAWAFLARPAVAFTIHGVTIWAWHSPAAFQWALQSNAIHILEHFCFFATAQLFWWSMLNRGGRTFQRYGTNTLWVLSTLIHTGFLGALLTFARYPLYAYYVERAELDGLLGGLTPLEDQQLGGTLMWVLGAGPYLLAGLILVLLCLRTLERRTNFQRE